MVPGGAVLCRAVLCGGIGIGQTEGLASKYPGRCTDFPPDETALIGAGIGFAQVGLLPIVEIPYAKYHPATQYSAVCQSE